MEAWTQYRARVVEYIAADPGWKVGPACLAMANSYIARLRSKP